MELQLGVWPFAGCLCQTVDSGRGFAGVVGFEVSSDKMVDSGTGFAGVVAFEVSSGEMVDSGRSFTGM